MKLVKATTELHDLGPKNRKLAIEFVYTYVPACKRAVRKECHNVAL